MADIQKTIQIIFGTTDDTASGIASVKSNLDVLDASIQSAAAPFASLADDILKTETAIIAMGAAMVAVSIDQAGKFQASVNEIGTLFGGTQESIAQFSGEILAYSQSSSKSIEDINSAVYTAISAGADYADALDIMSVAEKASIAGRADLESTTKVLLSTLNAYGLGTEDAARLSDLLFTTVKDGQTTLPELANSLSRVTGSAAAANIPMETLFAVVAAGTGYGLQTGAVMSGLSQVISNIVLPSQQAADEAARLGIEFNNSALNSKGLEGVLKDVATATGGNAESMRLLFGSVEAFNLVSLVGVDTGGKFAKALADMAESAGATDAAYEIMANNIDLVNQNIVNNIRAVLITAGTPLLEQFGSAGLALADVFKGLKVGLDEGAFSPVFDAINGFGADATTVFSQIATNLPEALGQLDLSPIIESLNTLGESMQSVFIDIFGDIDITTPEGLASALQTAVNILANLTNVASGIIDSFKPVFELIGQLGQKTADSSDKTSILIGNYLGYAKALVDFGSGIGALIIIAQETGASIEGVLNIILGSIKVMVNGFQVAFDTVTLTIAETLRQLLSDIAKVLNAVGLDSLGGAVEGVALSMAATVEGLKDDIVRNGNEAREGTDLVAQGFLQMMGDAEKAADGTVTSAVKVKDAVESASSGIYDLSQNVITAFDETGAAVARTESEFAKFDENGNIISTAKNGIELFSADAAAALGDLDTKVQESGGETKDYFVTWENGIPTYSNVGLAVEKVSEKLDASKESADKAKEAADAYKLKMAELASDERIAVIKGTFELNIAQLEAEAKKAVAVIEGLGTTITSTGEVLGTMFDLLANPDLGIGATFDIERQIRLENDLRQQAADDVHEMAQAQIDAYKAQADSLRSGTPLFSVNAEGVEPELRQLLFKLLELIQVEASGTYGNFLLALNP